MFRDSRGVVHTVSSSDPLDDLPAAASGALARTLLTPTHGDLGSALERCESVRQLLDRWQDAFFAALPPEIDLEEEARWAAKAGVSLEQIEAEWAADDEEDEQDWAADDETPGQMGLEQIDLAELKPLEGEHEDLFTPRDELPLDEDVVAELEVALVLLPVRVRLEALVAAAALVDDWADLLADHEKMVGHLVLKHGGAPVAAGHEALVDQHAILHGGRPEHPKQEFP